MTSAVQLCWCAVGKTAEAKRKKHEQSLICYKRLFTIDFFKKNKTKKNLYTMKAGLHVCYKNDNMGFCPITLNSGGNI